MKTLTLMAITACLSLGACSNPKDTPVPRDIDLGKMQTLKPALDKLTPEERDLAANYIARHATAAALDKAFGSLPAAGKDAGIPAGETLGEAIAEQRKYEAEQKAKEERQAELKAALVAKRDAAAKAMDGAVTVTLVSKKIVPNVGYGGIVTDTNLEVVFGYKNNTAKDIAGVKGMISIRDLFGDEISSFLVSNDTTIPAGKSVTWKGSRSVDYGFGHNKDRQLAALDDSKYKVVWQPQMIVFADGSKLALPDDGD